jgi:GAF domain-containing protein
MSSQQFPAAYEAALAMFVRTGGERALHAAYELGREAVALELSIVELARLHHAALERAVMGQPTADHSVVRAGGDFLAEVLSAFEIVRLGYEEAREAALAERRHAALVRRLSALLADTSLALEAQDSLAEILQLVAEGACELTAADGCIAIVRSRNAEGRIVALSGSATEGSPTGIVVPLTALDGRVLGSLGIVYSEGDGPTELDEAVLAHLAQMAAAALERALSYGGAIDR